MLSDRLTGPERAKLAPLLADVHATGAELNAAKDEKEAAELRLDKSKVGTGWRDRWFGGRRLQWDPAPLRKLPQPPDRLETARSPLHHLKRSAHASEKQLRGWKAQCVAARDRTVTTARNRLIAESGA